MPKAFKSIEESIVTISQLMLPSHSNFGGKIHGGYILSLMDQIAFACASKHSEYYCVTASVDKVDFLSPIEIGDLVTMKASINFVGTSSMVVGIRVDSENIQSGKTKHCNSSYFTMVAKNELGKNAKVPGLLLKNKEEIRRFLRGLKRKEEAKMNKDKNFDIEFKLEDNLDLIKDHNVKVEL